MFLSRVENISDIDLIIRHNHSHFTFSDDKGSGIRAQTIVQRDIDHGECKESLFSDDPLWTVSAVDAHHGVDTRHQAYTQQSSAKVLCSPRKIILRIKKYKNHLFFKKYTK